MARTKAEVRAFLDSLVGSVPVNQPNADYNGQCVTLIKVLLDFLGAPNPYGARGNAKDVGDALLNQNIAQPGTGWLTVIVNRDMGLIGGVRYGHIWLDLQGEANYESNGNRALHVTKNTRPYTQGQQFINLDKYIEKEDEDMKMTRDLIYWHFWTLGGREPYESDYKAYEGRNYFEATEEIKRYMANEGYGYYTYRVNAEAKDVSQEATIKSLRDSLAEKPKEVIIEKPVEVIKTVEVVKGDDERSLGDLLSAAFKKLFKIK